MHFNLVVVKSSNSEELARFYTLLGIHFEHHRHGNGPLHYAAEIDNIVFEIYPLAKSESTDSTLRLGFTVENIATILDEIRRSGIKILKEPSETEWGYICVVEDCDGRKIELKQKRS